MYELIKKKAVYYPDEQRHNIAMSENCKNFITRVSLPQTASPFVSSSAAARKEPCQSTGRPRWPRRSAGSPLAGRAGPRKDFEQTRGGPSAPLAIKRHAGREPVRLNLHARSGHNFSGASRQNVNHCKQQESVRQLLSLRSLLSLDSPRY